MATTDNTDEFDFTDLAERCRPVRYRGESFLLREASEAAAVAYRNAAVKAARYSDGKVTGVDGIGEVEPLLVGMCLFRTGPGGEVPTGTQFVKGMPARVVRPLFEWVKENSGLGEREDGAGPKEPPASSPTT